MANLLFRDESCSIDMVFRGPTYDGATVGLFLTAGTNQNLKLGS